MKRDLKADLELCNKATPGPWEICLGSGVNLCTAVMTADGKYMICDCLPDWFLDEGVAPENHVPNLQFIAEAREGWPHAIERALKAEALARELVEALGNHALFSPEERTLAEWDECEKRLEEVYLRAKEVLGDECEAWEHFCREKAELWAELWLDQALAEKERADKAEALARELVAALRRISEILDNATCRCRCGFCEYFNAQKIAEKSLAKAKEVLGDE